MKACSVMLRWRAVAACSLLSMLAIGCAAPRHLPRAPLAPLLDVSSAPVATDPMDSGAGLAQADPDIGAGFRREGIPAEPIPTAPIYRTVIRVREVPVAAAPESDPRAFAESWPVDELSYRYEPRRARRRGGFPINTAVGAGVGAIIGNQRGRRNRGALIGSGIGLLFDLRNWMR